MAQTQVAGEVVRRGHFKGQAIGFCCMLEMRKSEK